MSGRPNNADEENSEEGAMSESERAYNLGLPNLDYIFKVSPERKDADLEQETDSDDEKTDEAKRSFPPAWGPQDE